METARRLRLLNAIVAGQGGVVGAMCGAFLLPGVWASVWSYVSGAAAQPSRLGGALLGALVGWCIAFCRAELRDRRTRRLRQVAVEQGLRFSSGLIARLEDRVQEVFSGEHMIDLNNAVRKVIESGRLIVADLTWTEYRASGASQVSGSRERERTIACVEFSDVSLPEFMLQPGSRMLALAAIVTPIAKIDFPDCPDFTRAYHLTGAPIDRVRQLFNDRLLDFLCRNPGWEVRGDALFLIVSRPGSRCAPEELVEFIRQVTEVAETFHDAVSEMSEPPSKIATGTPAIVAAAPADASSDAANQVAIGDELTAFLSEQPPRRVPASIRRKRVASGNLIAVLLGAGLMAVGCLFAIMSGYVVSDLVDHTSLFAIVLGVSMMVTGLFFVGMAFHYRHWNLRILRKGIVTSGRIEKVRRTGIVVNERRRFRVALRFELNGAQQLAYCNLYGDLVELARRCSQESIPVRILFDPRRPTRVLWAQMLDTAPAKDS